MNLDKSTTPHQVIIITTSRVQTPHTHSHQLNTYHPFEEKEINKENLMGWNENGKLKHFILAHYMTKIEFLFFPHCIFENIIPNFL